MSNLEPKTGSRDQEDAVAQAYLAEFLRRMAEQWMIVRPASAGPDWVPPEPLPISADELSATVVRGRRRGL